MTRVTTQQLFSSMFLSSLIRLGRRVVITPNRWCACKTCPHCLSMRLFTSKNGAKGTNEGDEGVTKGEGQLQSRDGNELEGKFVELKDAYLRSLADMENLRER